MKIKVRPIGVRHSDEPMYVDSDRYFNDHDDSAMFEEMGFDVQPVDVMGGFVPQDKSLPNLKKTETAIQKRFALGKPE